ncbi:MAG: single-stranded-DNA-specific exonuclease RecJ [Halothiobacillus sp.]
MSHSDKTERPRIHRRPEPNIPAEMAALNSRLAAILVNRGIVAPIQLDSNLKHVLPSTDLPGIALAAAHISAAVQANARMLIVGDFDADGATATALCVLGLCAMGATQVAFTLPDRVRHGYGLSPAVLSDWLAQADAPPDLVITVDNGISAFAGVAAAQAMGAQVVITDHHLPGEHLPPADAIVNPNLLGSCFGSPALAGVGVAFYVLAAVRERLTDLGWFTPERPRPNLAQWLDLVAVGTVADVVTLDDNNRRLVAQGLERIRAQHCVPGISALFAVAGKDPRHATSMDLGFVVGPRLNAAGRLEDMRIGVACLLADDPATARQLAIELNDINQERRAIEQEMLFNLQKSGNSPGLNELNLPRPAHPADWVVFDETFHQGVIGIVAGRLKERWQRPVFVFAPEDARACDGPEARLKASGRSITGIHLRDVLVAMATTQPDLMLAFGGHAMAAGLSLERRNLPRFRQLFAQEIAKHQCHLPEQAVILSDGELSANELTLEFADSLSRCTPWGTDCPEPIFDNAFEVIECTPLKDGLHWRLRLRILQPKTELEQAGPAETRAILTAVWFGIGDQIPTGKYWQLAYRLNINQFRGQETLQLVVVAGQTL